MIYESTAYVKEEFLEDSGLSSEEFMLKRVGPSTEPWTMLALIVSVEDPEPLIIIIITF